MSMTITSFIPQTANILGGGTLQIKGTGFVRGCTVKIGGVFSPSVRLAGSISAQVLYVQIPAVITAGSYYITVTNPDGSNIVSTDLFVVREIILFNPSYPYTLTVNNEDITNLQKDRLSLVHETNIIQNYSISYNTVTFEMPLEKENILYPAPVDNDILVTQNGIIYFQGYITAKSVNKNSKIIKISAMPFLNLLSKYPVAYIDTVATDVCQNIINKFSALVSTLPKRYEVYPFVLNSSFLSGINIGINTGTSTPNAIDVIQSLFNLFDIGAMVWNNTIYLIAIPEDFQNQVGDDVSRFLLAPPTDIESLFALYFNKASLSYVTSPGGSDLVVTAGTGDVTNSVISDNVFFKDAASAQVLANRKYNLFSKTWTQAQNIFVSHEVKYKIGDYLTYEDYVFIINSIEDKYNSYALKCYGIKN